MDPLSITASVVALCSVGKAAYNIATSLYRSSNRVNGAGDDIETFAMDVDNFGIAMGTAHSALNPICISTNTTSRVIGYLDQEGGLKNLAEQSERLIKHITKHNPGIRALRGKLGFVARFKWTFQRKDINELRLRMESVKSNLQIIMVSIALEKAMEQPRTTDTENQM
jgi:hypothetical protein